MMSIDSKKVKIIATIGPASNSPEMLEKLARRGVDVFRLNLSHKNKEEIVEDIINIRNVEKKIGRALTIMADLSGPKIRTGSIATETQANVGDEIEITKKQLDTGSAQKFNLNFPDIIDGLEVGREIYLNDGMPTLEVVSKNNDSVITKVVVGGILKSKMGFSAEGIVLNDFEVTEKDAQDIETSLGINNDQVVADALAVSFVQTAKDIEKIKNLIPESRHPMVLAKIETQAGVKNAAEILAIADGLMVARGDLGFAVPLAEIPHIQKKLINLCLKMGKPVITATQMLESMTQSHLPTRAEVTDVANAILDGTDAVMLSGETARGKYPEEVIKTMVKIIDKALPHIQHRDFPEDNDAYDAVGISAATLADRIKAKLIMVFTESGATARRISRHRPRQPILALTPNEKTLHDLNFTWGIKAEIVKNLYNFDDFLIEAKKIAEKNKLIELKPGDHYVFSAGVPFGRSGSTNMILVQKI
ncbi:MAG TPA: pyruvate kinase [Candidatus Paceibacterota bacterium]